MNAFFSAVEGFFHRIDFTLFDVLDILLVAVIVYYVIKFIRDTRAGQLLKGIALILIFLGVANFLNLSATKFILANTIEYGVLAMLIIFQPELRSVLERLGRNGFKSFSFIKKMSNNEDEEKAGIEDMITSVCDAASSLSTTKTGALLVIENQTKLGEIIGTGVVIDSVISTDMLLNIFYPKAPLHDGAAIIRGGRLHAAGCWLPLSTRVLPSELGTRHRAAVGVSEVSDALVIVVSEETGIISVVQDGKLTRRLTPDTLRTLLEKTFTSNQEERKELLKGLLRGKRK